MSHEGLQDDRRFVENFVHVAYHQGKGPVRIRAELAGRGVDRALVDEVLDERGEDWARSRARGPAERKFGTELPRQFAEKARQMRFLQYRGFDVAIQVRAAME